MERANIVIIGAGIVGLAVAANLSEENEGVYVLERNSRFGQETSSHNSGVIHSGIHYPPGSLKARLCVEGNSMIYKICEKYKIPCKKLGKLTVAVEEREIAELERLIRWGEANGVEGLKMLDREDVKKMEPHVEAERAIYTPSTGIVEPDDLMSYFYAKASKNGAVLVTKTEVTGLKKTEDGYEVSGISFGEKFTLKANSVINCAGLHSDKIACMVELDVNKLGYRLHYCKGDYFRVAGALPVKMLVYPVPEGGVLGIHLTPDVAGTIRLGPNAYYVDRISYEVTSPEREFREGVAKFLPCIRNSQLTPDFAGVRPKLQGPGEGFRDFVIRHEADRGLFSFINLIGIESPGLTAAPAIGKFVSEMYKEEIKK
ncbi:MAG: NAD(P)/FAD-dependent oxidoreductase [Nitrososphaerota archaeon]|nr:NAD(P)/FAD-dependent oxidoreductase [Candidatus Bathyarchaeota archaeon]MDW8022554.1 NAD(P)/FAD-dependent oxidoreductase [Nitrososphaerota archaeon]